MKTKAPYKFTAEALQMLGLGLRKAYLGMKVEIIDIYILHSDTHPPTLVVKSACPDGTVIRSDIPFFGGE